MIITPDQPKWQKKKKRSKVRLASPPTPAQLEHRKAHEIRMAPLLAERKRKQAEARAAGAARRAKNAAEKDERQAQAKLQQQQAAARKKQTEKERKVREAARRAAFAEYQKTPAYAAEMAKEAAAMNAKKKSHLQAWVENETQLRGDREALRIKWRKRLISGKADRILSEFDSDSDGSES